MPRFHSAKVNEIIEKRDGLQKVLLDDGASAYALTEVLGIVEVGDVVVVNTTAVDLALGTGGWHVVHWIENRANASQNLKGSVLKARYLSEQTDVSAHVSSRTGLEGARVLLCLLHSHIGAVAIASASTNLGYVMTDQSALPLALSDLMQELLQENLVSLTATAGQAFGGHLEVINVPSGVAALLDNHCSQILVGAGPGHVGTASPLGFSGLDLAGHASMLSSLGAEVAICVRASEVDARGRHRGISHHMETILKAIPTQIEVPVPVGLDAGWVSALGHTPQFLEPLDVAAAVHTAGIDLMTMTRPLVDDELACSYLGAAAAWLTGPIR